MRSTVDIPSWRRESLLASGDLGHVDAYAGLVALDDEMLADVARALRDL
jgi:hypothetical protein